MIKFIYFDVGGVLVDDFSGNNGWEILKAELGITPEQDAAFMKAFYPLEHEVLVGRDIETIMPELRAKFGINVSHDYSMLEDFVTRFKPNKAIWPAIEVAQQKAQVGLLTNMYPHMLTRIKERGLLPPTEWSIVVDSSVESYKKPDPQLFEIAQRVAGVSGDEILFIDNTQRNVDAARDFGWEAYFYDATDHQQSSAKLLKYLQALNKERP